MKSTIYPTFRYPKVIDHIEWKMMFGSPDLQENMEIDMLDIPDDEADFSGKKTQENDEVSNAPVVSYSNGPIEGDIDFWKNSGNIIKFKLNPVQYSGVLFTSNVNPHDRKKINKNQSKVFVVDFSEYDLSESYSKYVISLYKIIEALGDSNEIQKPSIGLITTPSLAESNIINFSFEGIVDSLIELINDKREQNEQDERLFDLEELLYILECLKSNFFTDSIIEKPTRLSNWINRADPKPDLDYTKSIMTSAKPHLRPEFWSVYIPKLLIRGLFNEAQNAIETSKYEELTQTDNDLYLAISDLLSIISNNYLIKKGQFNEWKSAACQVRDNMGKANFKNQLMAKEIYDIFGILTGLPKTIANYCDNWYEMYVALVLYQVQDKSLYNEYYKLAKTEKPPSIIADSNSPWQIACIDILENNFLKVIRTIEELDTPTGAYIAKLCEAKGLLESYSKDFSILGNFGSEDLTISENLLNNHALDCLNIDRLVPVGIGILINLRTAQARATVSEFLPTYYCKTNDDLEWALSICSKLEIPQTAQTIFKITARRSFDDGHFFEALTLYARGDDVTSVRNNCWTLFELSLIRGEAVDDELINNIVSGRANVEINPIVRQCLAPYAILLQFFSIQQKESIRSSIIKLISLLRFNHLPLKYFPLLASNLLPFIAIISSPRILTLQELVVIIGLINNYENIVDHDDREKGELLYKYATNEKTLKKIESNEYDWRNQLTKNEINLPNSLSGLLKLLRKCIANEISRTYLEEA